MNRTFVMHGPVATALVAACLAGTAYAQAQETLMFADREANKLWPLTDVNGDGTYQFPDEAFVWTSTVFAGDIEYFFQRWEAGGC